jgi:hypothetical protein
MHLNTQIDDNLWQEALRVSGEKTPQTLITEVLREYIQHHRMLEKPLADIPDEKARLLEKKPTVWDAVQTFRDRLEPGDLEPNEDVFANVRDRSYGENPCNSN